jgi:lysyl-tRNA synthetase class 2
LESDKKSLNQIIDHRLEKLKKIREAGHNPYAYEFDKLDNIQDINEEGAKQIGCKIQTAGRIVSQRKMGKAAFVHIQDDCDKIQVYLKDDLLPNDIYDQIVRNLDLGDIIGCSGEIFITKTKELSIKANSVSLLSKNIRPLPNLKEKEGVLFNSFEDKELRYRHRQLDLIANPEVKKIFIKRTNIIRSVRNFLDDHGYLEVETPVLQPIYGGASARPFTTYHNSLNQSLFLRIADELYLKRLIIGGFEKVYEIAKNFRNEGMDKNHNPEFTSLEFYAAYSDMYSMMDITESLIKNVAKQVDSLMINYDENQINLEVPFEKKTMFDLIEEYSGVDIIGMDIKDLMKLVSSKNIELTPGMNHGQLIDKLFGEIVEPNLIMPTFVLDYPVSMSPLAKKKRDGSADLVERFELFICGMEFANSFSEQNDPQEQKDRFVDQTVLRDEGDEEAHVFDENFIQAMEVGMPPTGGVGIGIDRLVMLLTQQKSIKDVILFPTLRPED